jgi:hypothetical protein
LCSAVLCDSKAAACESEQHRIVSYRIVWRCEVSRLWWFLLLLLLHLCSSSLFKGQ